MKRLEIIREVQRHLEESEPLSYRMLRREFGLDDEALEELIEELVDIRRVAVREDKALAWSGTPAGGRSCRRAVVGEAEGSAGASPSQKSPAAYSA